MALVLEPQNLLSQVLLEANLSRVGPQGVGKMGLVRLGGKWEV